MYAVGDLILYGSTGVCRVTDIQEKQFDRSAGTQPYYILEPLYQDCTISAPALGGKVFTRPILTRQEACDLIDTIPTIHAQAFHSSVLRELSEHYEAALRSHDCAALLELTMSIYAKKQKALAEKRKFGALDERFLKRAEDLLFGELAAALGIERDRVCDFIDARLNGREACV